MHTQKRFPFSSALASILSCRRLSSSSSANLSKDFSCSLIMKCSHMCFQILPTLYMCITNIALNWDINMSSFYVLYSVFSEFLGVIADNANPNSSPIFISPSLNFIMKKTVKLKICNLWRCQRTLKSEQRTTRNNKSRSIIFPTLLKQRFSYKFEDLTPSKNDNAYVSLSQSCY